MVEEEFLSRLRFLRFLHGEAFCFLAGRVGVVEMLVAELGVLDCKRFHRENELSFEVGDALFARG